MREDTGWIDTAGSRDNCGIFLLWKEVPNYPIGKDPAPVKSTMRQRNHYAQDVQLHFFLALLS